MTDTAKLSVIVGLLGCSVAGWGLAGPAGTGAGVALGALLLVIPYRRQPLWSWVGLYRRRRRPLDLVAPTTVSNDRSAGGVRFQDDVAVAAIQLLGRRLAPTLLTGSTGSETADVIDIASLAPLMRQSLGLRLESLSVITAGARRYGGGDYPRIYDSFIGTHPYAGRRETWIVIRLRGLPNADPLTVRPTVGTAVLAAAQRVAGVLRCEGIRARVATATELAELERRLVDGALESSNRSWHSLRGDSGWHTTYGYRAADICSGALSEAWSLRADGIVQNLTLRADGTVSATVTVRTPQPPTESPMTRLQTLPGQQAQGLAANRAGPRPDLRAVERGALPSSLIVPIGPSGILLGRAAGGERLLLPLGDPADQVRVHVAAEDAIAKRILIRLAAAGERVTVHTTDLARWAGVRMPNVAVIEHPRPAAGSTVGVVDGTVVPALKPHTLLSVGPVGSAIPAGADVTITQTGQSTIEVLTGVQRLEIDMELFRAENRYAENQDAENQDAENPDAENPDAANPDAANPDATVESDREMAI